MTLADTERRSPDADANTAAGTPPQPGSPADPGTTAALPACVLILGDDGRIREANDQAWALFGRPLDGETWPAVLARLEATGDPAGEITLGDGRRLRIAERRIGPHGGALLLIDDITSQRKLTDALARHRRLAALGEMAATIAHQIRTPLSAALLYASNAASPTLRPERREELLGRAIDCLHDLEQLVSDMLGFARGAVTRDTWVTLADVAAGLRTAAEPLLQPGQQLHIGRPAGRLGFHGNREAVTGALLNLVSNALQSAGARARVDVSLGSGPEGVEIRVADNGPGVPPALRHQVFTPFYTSRDDGTGLGLAVVQSVAEAHGGSVRIEDNPPRGACFVLSLPVAGRQQGQTRHLGLGRRSNRRKEHQAA